MQDYEWDGFRVLAVAMWIYVNLEAMVKSVTAQTN